ncbi:MAG: response regulator, partial [Nitrospinota bacterium]
NILIHLIRRYLPQKKKMILIVDDKKPIHNLIKKTLNQAGPYEFVSAFSSDEALAFIKEFQPDLVISDIGVPGKDGFKVCSTIKSTRSTSQIPVMILSGRTDEGIIERGFEAGADEYITKPFHGDELINKVEFLFSEIVRKRRERVLVVDNNPHVLNSIANGILQQGFTVLTAGNFKQGLKMALDSPPDVIVSAVDSKVTDGFEFCRKIKSAKKTKSIPFIALTPKDSKGIRGLGKRVGVNSYLTKPFQIEKIVVLIERYLAAKRGMLDAEREMMIGSITSLAKALDEKDTYTCFHSENVSKYSVEIAKNIRLSENEVEAIGLAALLHDIGKIGIRDDILLKPGPLDKKEYKLIQEHPKKGASILKPISSLQKIIPYILHHHEKFDGTGYPVGLNGQDIPLGARIIAVSDTFDSLTTDRPYRKKLDKNNALRVIENLSGTTLCPFCIKMLLNVVNK